LQADSIYLAKALSATSVMDAASDQRWLADFHSGDRAVLEQCYRDHCPGVMRTVGRLLTGADTETVTHEVFYRLLSNARLRENFQGGHFDAWLNRVAVNSARDHLRRLRREHVEIDEDVSHSASSAEPVPSLSDEVEAKVLIDRFRRERLPAEWANVFEARFIQQLPQRQAAEMLGMHRTTLVYQEQRVRELLRDFLLRGDSS
jgi:RNA polymerase sigma-70 factor (ECF subfamily)